MAWRACEHVDVANKAFAARPGARLTRALQDPSVGCWRASASASEGEGEGAICVEAAAGMGGSRRVGGSPGSLRAWLHGCGWPRHAAPGTRRLAARRSPPFSGRPPLGHFRVQRASALRALYSE